MKQSAFESLVTKYVTPDDMKNYVIDLLINKPERLIGYEKVNPVPLRVISSFGQSNNIKNGTVLEEFINYTVVANTNLTIFPRKKFVPTVAESNLFFSNREPKKHVSMDNIFQDTVNKKVVFLEDKFNDDHDNTKIDGQLNNFFLKAKILLREFPGYSITGIIFFLSDGYDKWGTKYFKPELQKVKLGQNNSFTTADISRLTLSVAHGDEISRLLGLNTVNLYTEFKTNMQNWHMRIGERLPEYNLDKYPFDIAAILEKKAPDTLLTLFANEDLKQQVFPYIFPNNQVQKVLNIFLENKLRSTKDPQKKLKYKKIILLLQ